MIPEIELFELDDKIDSVAVVDYPAIGINFMYFAKQEAPQKYVFADEEKHQLTGCFLVPELRIPRYDEQGNQYNVFFSADTVKKIAYDFMSNRQMNIAHSQDTDKLVLVESWIKTDEQMDKSMSLGIAAPVGSWFASVKVNDEALWQQIKAGDYRGFSIEGVFQSNKNEDFKAQQDSDEKLLNEIKNLIAQWNE